MNYDDILWFRSGKCFEMFETQKVTICQTGGGQSNTPVYSTKKCGCGDVSLITSEGAICYGQDCVGIDWTHSRWFKAYNLENCMIEFAKFGEHVWLDDIVFDFCEESNLVSILGNVEAEQVNHEEL